MHYQHCSQHLKIHALLEKMNEYRSYAMIISVRNGRPIARILVKGLYQLNFFPAKLNQAFIIATLFGENVTGSATQLVLILFIQG